mgnify:CR=1 FL=1
MMIGRAIGKIRTQKLGELLIKTLSDMGPVSRIAVCVALSMTDRTADSVHYLSRLQETASGQEETDLPIPSQRMISLLSLISADYTDVVEPILRNAKFDLQKAYGIEDFPYPAFWTDVRHFDAPLLCHNGPFAGRVRLATTDNMVQLAREVNLADVVCLTEPRVVDALFDRAGAVLSAEPDVDAPRHRRLQGRSIPFAAVTPEAMAAVAKAHAVAASPERVSVMA